MNETAELRRKASDLRKGRRYAEAMHLYQELWHEHRDTCNEWDGWGLASCLRKVGESKKALEVCRDVYQLAPDFVQGRSLYAWCIYDTELKKENEEILRDENTFFKAAKAILGLTQQDQYTPYVKTVFRVIDYIAKSRSSFPAKDILPWVDELDYNGLSETPFSFVSDDGKRMEIQSDKEKWFAIKTKALEKSASYRECIELSEMALNSIRKFHSSNDIWLKRRIALSKANLGDKKSSADDLENLLRDRKEWFIQHKLAQIHFDLDQTDQALKYAIDAALNFGKDENKCGLFMLMAQILIEKGDTDEAERHLAFAASLRVDSGWTITDPLQKLLKEYNVDWESKNKKDLKKALRQFWSQQKFLGLPAMQGVIKTILPNGKAGFISGDDGKEYYFNITEFKGDKKNLTRGAKIIFNIIDSFDKKKNRETKAAANLREQFS